MQPLSCDLWLMEQSAFRQFVGGFNVRIDAEQAREVAKANAKRQQTVGIVPVHGPLEARPSFLGEMLGMSSYEAIGMAFDSLLYDEGVKGIVLDVVSPGGMVYGAQELADKIYSARGRKPVIAVANPLAASGAYWIAAAADRLVVTPSGDVGSVGVITEHVDMTKAIESQGGKVTTIRSEKSPYKGETSEYEALSDEAKAHLQSRADGIYAKFVGDLAKFRGVSVDHVNERFGKGRVVDAKSAMSAGMVDRIDTLQGVVIKMMDGRIRLGKERAMDVWDAPTPKESRLERFHSVSAKIQAAMQSTPEKATSWTS